MLMSTFNRFRLHRFLYKKCRNKYLFPHYSKLHEPTTICLYTSLHKKMNVFSSQICNEVISNRKSSMSLAEIQESTPNKSYFEQIMLERKKQSQRSILLQISNPADIPYALSSCEKFGKILKAYSIPEDSGNCFLLIEFSDISEVQNLLLNCHCKNIGDAFPVYSQIIQYERLTSVNTAKSDVDLIEDTAHVSSLKKGSSVSDVIEDIYATEKISELNTRIRYFFCTLIRNSISGLFPYSDVLPFGSSVNGIGRHGCDLDVMIRLYPEQINEDGEFFFLSKTCIGDVRILQQKAVFCLGDYFKTFFPGVSSVQRILHARMPILKLKHRILKMDCDVSVNNMSAVLMSEIIHFCGEIDHRVRPLLYAVKKWAKEADITYEKPGTYITNFGLTILVIFFLQNRSAPILPALNDALVIQGEDPSPEYKIQYLKSLLDWKTSATLNEESLACLLKEFLTFLGSFSFKDCTISLMTGKTEPREKGGPIYIQYPFEEDLNITKNVSDFEFWEMSEKALISSKYLEKQLNMKFSNSKDFTTILGISNLKKKEGPKLKNPNSMTEDHKNHLKKKLNHRRIL